MIYANVELTVEDRKTVANKNIVLYRGDKNVEIRFVIKGNRFTVLDSTYAQMIIKRPSAMSVFSDPVPIQNDTVVFTISEDMIDELKEIGAYTFQVRLYDNSMNARATLPPCEGCLIINQPIATEGEALVNAAMINDSAVLAAAYSDVPEEEIFDNNNAYNRTLWVDGDIITDVRMNKIEDALYYINEKGGGGTATAPYISTSLPETVMVGSGEDFELDLDFSSPNLGKGTLKVFINDVDSMNQKIDQGMSITTIPGSLFSKGTNMVVIYVLDRVGMMSNSLTFYIRYGGTEVTSTFDAYTSYDYGATVRYYFTPTALDTSLQLTFYMEIDGVTQAGVPCISDVRSYYTFPTNLSVGNHYCRAWVTDGTTRSNVLAFNLIILDATSLVVATDTLNPTVEEGTQLVLDYKVYMKNNTSFITKTYVDNNLINTGTCTLETAYYRSTNLTAGTHTIKVEVFDVTETYSDFVTWTVTVTESTYTMLEPAKAGSTFMATAYNKSNVDENRDVWIGSNQDDDDITATLSNFSFNSENGWIDDALVISGNSWVEIPIQPLANNAQYGFTLDIEFKTKAIGVEDAEVLTLWNETDNCGIKITTEQLIMRSKTGNQCDLYFSEDEIVSAIFVIDRDEKTAKIYLNGVMCEAFALSDYEAAGQKFLEDFTVNSNVYLGGYNKNGYCAIKNIRIYEVALATNEILNNFMSNEKDKAAQRALVEFQKGNTLPTLTIYCDFAGLGKDDKKPCNIVYNSPDVNLYGESFTLDGKYSMLQYQGTSSMQYPIKNYRINPRNADGKVKLDPFNNGVGESRFTLKADFMSSGHWQNTGLAKWVNDKLYNYNVNDESTMNARKWYDLQNGGSLKGTRESINGFPCRLILVNDGETALNEGQQEPTPGNTKDMGIFNFNNDKDNVETLGFDTDIFPNCMSFEVTANSDTSAGAFVPYNEERIINGYMDGVNLYTNYMYQSEWAKLSVNFDGQIHTNARIYWYSELNDTPWDQAGAGSDGSFNPTYRSNPYFQLVFFGLGQRNAITINDITYKINYVSSRADLYSEVMSTVVDENSELKYLQNSFELRYPDADDVGGDYGYLGIKKEGKYVDYWNSAGYIFTTKISTSLMNGNIQVEYPLGGKFEVVFYNKDGALANTISHNDNGTNVEIPNGTIYFSVRNQDNGSIKQDYIIINGVKYLYGLDLSNEESQIKDPYISEIISSDYGLKRVIDWVGNATDEQFVAEFDQYFHRDYTLRYYLLVITLGMVDNLGKNMMFDTFDGKIWLPRFYDMDTICSYDNSGEIKFDVDIEMEQGYWNTSSSRLWTKIRDLMHDELVEKYNNMRQNGMSYESFMSYFYNKQIAQIPQTYYNKDYDVKYAPYADEYMGKAHGDGYEHLKRWLKRRLIFTDTLFDYAPSYTNDALTIRANTLDLMSLEIETYTPVYQHVSFYNGNMEKIKIDGKTSTVFNGTAQTATDQEVLIYGGSNIKSIKGIQSMNPNSMLIGNATRLTELDLSDCPILTVVNSNKANFSPHTYLNKLDISNCPQLGGTLNISNSPLLQEVNALGSVVDNILFPTSVRNLETLRVPKTITSLTLNDAGLLYTLEMEEGNNLQSISMTNCNNLTEMINFDLTQTPTVFLDNSFNGEEIYMTTTNLTLKNMPSLKRVIFTPNSEYSAFDINNVLNGANYKITTFNNPMMTDFITTAPHRLSYKNGDYGDITPNTAFTANTLDLADTQFQNVKFLCTTDVYNLKVPTTMKNFYCDSAMDIDTDVIEDASYEVIHEELIEPYTTNYEGEVYRYDEEVITTKLYDISIPGRLLENDTGDGDGGSVDAYVMTDYIPTKPGSTITFDFSNENVIKCYDKNKVYIPGSMARGNNTLSYTVPSNAYYFRAGQWIWGNTTITYTKALYNTPNIIPSSANGSLIFNMYSNNTTQPNSTSPYMWDLTGLKLEDFYTYGMNNWVKASEGSLTPIPNYEGLVCTPGKYGNTINITYYDSGQASRRVVGIFKLEPGTHTLKQSGTDNPTTYYSTSPTGTVTAKYSAATWTTTETIYFVFYDNAVDIEWVEVDGLRYHVDKMINTYASGSVDILEYSNNKTCTPVVDRLGLSEVKSITMPQRMPGYSVRLVNADITPDEYPTMLYPKLIDTTLPITGKLDYTKYNGTSLAWAYAYTTGDVTIDPLDSRNIGQIEFDYNKLYGTDFIDIRDVWVYKDTDVSKLSTNEVITEAYIELTSDNYKTRVDEVLAYYSNCTDVYFFEDGSVTTLDYLLGKEGSNYGNQTYQSQIKNVTFMEGYFKNVTNAYAMFYQNTYIESITNIPNSITSAGRMLQNCSNLTYVSNLPSNIKTLFSGFASCVNLVNVPSIPNTITDTTSLFSNCPKLNTQIDLSNCTQISVDKLNSTFNGCSSLTHTPVLPSNYTGTLANCFKGCSSLTQAPTIPNGVTRMNATFHGCTSLTTAPVISDSVTDLSSAFLGCDSLTTVPNIPSSCTSYHETFRDCDNLVSVPINGWKGRMSGTFCECYALNQQINIESATTLDYTFRNCKALTTPPNLPSDYSGYMSNTFDKCESLTTAPTIPNGVTSMYSTFNGCTSLTQAPTIPSSVTEMSSCFKDCTSLTTGATFEGTECRIEQLYRGCTNLISCSLPLGGKDYLSSYSDCVWGCYALTSITWLGEINISFDGSYLVHSSLPIETVKQAISDLIPEHLSTTTATATLGNYASYLSFGEIMSAQTKGWTIKGDFSSWDYAMVNASTNLSETNSNITTVIIELTSSNYTSRINQVLQYYPNCTDLIFFDDGSVTSLFYMMSGSSYKSQIKTVEFLDGYFDNLTDMENTFQGCSVLTKVTGIPSGVTKMARCFQNCYKLAQVPTIPQGVTDLYETFKSCSSLTMAPTLPNSVTDIRSAFQGCTALTTVPNLPNGITDMKNTFLGCSSLTTVPAIPSSVTSMYSTFQSCSSLTTAPAMPNGVTDMYSTFYNCTSLTTVPNIPSSATLMESTFQSCSSLTTVPTIPSSVTDMGYTFYGCKALTQAPKILSISITDIKSLYSGCTNLQSCDVPIYVDTCNSALYNVPSTCDVTWLGERTTDLNVTSTLSYKNANAADIQELVPEHLADLTSQGTTATLTLGSTYLAYLTEDEIAAAVAKGWTIQ